MRVGIHQPNYIPWCGYFTKIASCDVFIYLDDAEISPGQSYVYRSQLRDAKQALWFSQPSRRHPHELILEVEFSDPKWARSHLDRISQTYRKAPYFIEVMDLITSIYDGAGYRLALFNMTMIQTICIYLEIETHFEISSHLKPAGTSDERLISLVQLVGADTYVSGKGGQNYQDPLKFFEAGIQLEIRKYNPIPYQQIHGEFIGGLSILDALFNLGKKTKEILVYG